MNSDVLNMDVQKCSLHGFNEFLSKLDRENRDVVTQNEFQVRDLRSLLDLKKGPTNPLM